MKMTRKHLVTCLSIASMLATARIGLSAQTQFEKARSRADSLRLGSYATSHQVQQIAVDEDFRTRTWDAIQRMGITKLYIEVYRGGHTVSAEHLVFVRDWLRSHGIEVVGGIATVPGGEVGVRQEGPLDWFNWQSVTTRRDLEEIVRMAAPIFDTFIIDDFLCTGDVSSESRQAKGDRSWGEYRRALMTQVARSVFIEPARQANPDITMVVKFPQWHDRFHLFGYDTETLPRLFDRVWVGTETRGRNTQRFGFVQPYEGFVNYRWLAGISGERIGGAWFDHGDCAEHDFLDQAYTSVLAGARELVFFNLGDIVQGHPDHAKVAEQFDRLADLASFVRAHPVVGVPAYKPPNSDPAGDMYLMDFLGMLGIPLAPVHRFPESASTIFLPAQAAADPDLLDRVKDALDRGANVVVTTNLLLTLPQDGELARMLGVDPNLESSPIRGACVGRASQAAMIDLEAPLEANKPGDIGCSVAGRSLLLLRTVRASQGRGSLLNTHTYSQADFDAVGEVLLCPRPLGLLALDGSPLEALRAAFRGPGGLSLAGPSCVTLHPFSESGDAGFVVQNFNDRDVTVAITVPRRKGRDRRALDRLSGKPASALPTESQGEVLLEIPVPARGRVWIQFLT